MQDLVNSFDDIPALMRRIRESKPSSTRFNVIEPNQSYQVNHVLRGHESLDVNEADNKARANRMATQARRVLDHLSKLPAEKAHRMVQTVADVAANRLQHLQRNGVDLNRYYMQYDIHRTGRISHKDFADTLISVSSGVSRNELTSLATALDPHKTGFVDYKQLLPKLNELRNEAPSRPQVDIASALDLASNKGKAFNPRDIVDLQSLPPTRKECSNDPLNPNLPTPNRGRSAAQRSVAGRRLFHDRTTDILYRRDAPYFTEDMTTIKNEKRAQRSHSAPPLGNRGPQSLRQVVLEEQASKTSNVVVEAGAVPLSSSLRTHAMKSYSQPSQSPVVVSPTRVLTQIPNRSSQTAAENTLLTQIGGNLDSLGRLFKRQDKSHSGRVNYNEFKAALMKCGAHLNEQAVKAMFDKRCLDGHEKMVDIQSFVGEMKGRASAPLFAHLQADYMETKVKADQCRAYRKALHAINKHGDPLSLARSSSTSTSHSALVNPSLNEYELRQAWLISNANLTSTEVDAIINTIKPALHAEGGSLRIEQVDTILRQSLATNTHSLDEQKQKQIQSSGRRYGPSFRSQIQFGGSDENVTHSEFHAVTDSKHVKEKQKHWGKVQETIQSQPDAILRAFSGGDADGRSVPIAEVGKRLSRAGIMLGKEDIAQLHARLGTGNNGGVSLEQFCEKLNVPLQTDRFTNQQRPLDPRCMEQEHGIFTSSHNTVCSEPNYATSALLETEASQRKYDFGARRKPRPSGDDLVGEAFWNMDKSVENPMAFPTVWPERNHHQQQRGFYRPSAGRLSTASLHRLEADPKQAARGLISLRTAMSDSASSVAGRSISTKSSSLRYYAGGGSAGGGGGNRSVASAATSSTVVPGHVIGGGRRSGARALSAPPRSTLQLVTGVDESAAAMENMAAALSATATQQAPQQAPTSQSVPVVKAHGTMSQADQISRAASLDAGLQQVSRWSNNALAEYYKAREQLYGSNGRPSTENLYVRNEADERIGRSTSRSQPQSRASSPGGSSVTSISSRRSLRRQYTQSVGAPFATDND